MRPDTLILLCTARGTTHRILTGSSRGLPDYTFADAAWAMSKLHPRYQDAFMYRIAGDTSVRSRLWANVFQYALYLKYHEQWPAKVNGKKYLERMTNLLLDEEQWQAGQQNNFVRAAVMDVSQRTWYRRLRTPYRQLQSELDSWVGTAWRHIRKRLDNY